MSTTIPITGEGEAASSPLVYMYGTDTSDMRNKYCTGQRAELDRRKCHQEVPRLREGKRERGTWTYEKTSIDDATFS
jgi:hypothetical protein